MRSLLALLVVLSGCTTADAQRSSSSAGAPFGGLTVVERGDASADAALVLMHGWGAPGDDLVPLADQLAAATPLRVIVPAGPVAMRGAGRAWYDLHADDASAQAGVARVAIEGVLDTLAQRGVPSERVIVGGFSQGAIMSIEVGLHRRVAGLALLSGRSLPHPESAYRPLSGLPIFLSHGRADRVIPFERSESFRARATRAGAIVDPVPFDGGHAIPPVVVERLTRWLRATLDR